MRQHVHETRVRIQAALEAQRLTAEAIDARLCARRAELEENLYDGILTRPLPAPTTAAPIYGSKPLTEVVDAAKATVYKNVLHHFKQLVVEKHELLNQF